MLTWELLTTLPSPIAEMIWSFFNVIQFDFGFFRKLLKVSDLLGAKLQKWKSKHIKITRRKNYWIIYVGSNQLASSVLWFRIF